MNKKKYYRTKEFIKLQNQWYDKLSENGFSDLEWLDKSSGQGQNTPFLKNSLNKFNQLRLSELENRMEYFSAVQDFHSQHNFPTERHKYMWLLYSKGLSYRQMIPKLTEQGFEKVSIFWISEHLKKLKKAFALWQLNQPDEIETLQQFMENNRNI